MLHISWTLTSSGVFMLPFSLTEVSSVVPMLPVRWIMSNNGMTMLLFVKLWVDPVCLIGSVAFHQSH